MKKFGPGDRVEVPCSLHRWNPCACFSRGPWIIFEVDGKGFARAKHEDGRITVLGFEVSLARRATASRLQVQPNCSNTQARGMSDKPAYPTDWTSKIAFMRENNVTSATWSDNQHFPVLIDVRLGAPPAPADEGPAEQQETAAARLARERKERRELAGRASGGPVPRLDEGH